MPERAKNRTYLDNSRPLVYRQSRPLQGARQTVSFDMVQPPKSHLQPKPALQRGRSSSNAIPALPRQNRSRVLNRQLVQAAVPSKKAKRSAQKTSRPSLAAYPLKRLSMAALILLMASGLWSSGVRLPFSNNVKSQTVVQVPAKPQEGSQIDETPVSQAVISDYEVAAGLPRIISIQRLQLYARVVHIPTVTGQTMVAPANIYDAGWHTNTAKPGEGVMLLSGHVFGAQSPGLFYRLGNLKKDDQIVVETGDRKRFNYRVVKTAIYEHDKIDLGAILSPAEVGKAGLNLLSHNNRYDVITGKYGQQVAVFAVLDNH